MENHKPLAPRLDYCRRLPGAWLASYEALIARLRRSGTASGAPGVGELAADFALPDVDGRLRRLSDLLVEGPVVLSFNRGSWCPYCEQEIGAWSEHLAELAREGARLVIITPETGGRMRALATLAGPGSVVLCDANLGLALRYGLAFPVGAEVLQQFIEDDLDLGQVNGTSNGFLPVPATFLLDQSGRVRFAFADPDFTQRAEPADVLAALSALNAAT